MANEKKSLLDMPAHEAVAKIARRHLAAAARGLIRLENPGDPKGLHGFRTAIRRLRSLLRAYKPWLGKVAGDKVRRRLRELTEATNSVRDVDVQLQWLSLQHETLTRDERTGYVWLQRRLRSRQRREYRAADKSIGGQFADIVKLIGKRLKNDGAVSRVSFRQAFLEALAPQTVDLQQRLAAISGPGDMKKVHRLRIQVKRLRYLIEPLRTELAQVRPVIKQLKALQTGLGELHDMHVFEEELGTAFEDAAMEKAQRLHRLALHSDEKALKRQLRRDESLGLATLASRARERRNDLYEDLRRHWPDNGAGLRSDLTMLSRLVAGTSGGAAISGGEASARSTERGERG